ncbi:SRPBCC family protein [Gordonia phthalatica]|uniref:ATPase n=1 Tax=Gordonia phthalatica TaxID=1136941 RepID=A0A0N9N7A8_9ACTN|nr:SRPBCC domain-containing protein [Gordonia phthalatica]ALG86531.1 ATPase [Gordonia phthalatica]
MFDIERDPSAVELGVFAPQPPTVVWRALVEPDLMQSWLSRPIGFEPVEGTSFLVEVLSEPPHHVACQVLTVVPRTRLVYTWTDPRGDAPATWTVDWHLEAQGRGTRVLLVFSGFDMNDRIQKMARNAVERGWRNQVLPSLLASVASL